MPHQPPHIASNCISQEASSISAGSASTGGQQPPVVIASSVMADDGQRTKSASSSAVSATYTKSALVFRISTLKDTLFTLNLVEVCLGWVLSMLGGT